MDVDKLKTVTTDLSKLSNLVNDNAAKQAAFNQLVTKVNATDTKIPNTSGLVTTAQYDSNKQKVFCKGN